MWINISISINRDLLSLIMILVITRTTLSLLYQVIKSALFRTLVKSWNRGKSTASQSSPIREYPGGRGETKQRGEQKGGGEQRKREGGEEGGGEKDEEEEASLASSVKGAKKRAFVIRRGCLRGWATAVMPCNSKVYHATVASCTIVVVVVSVAAVVIVHIIVVELLKHGRVAASPARWARSTLTRYWYMWARRADTRISCTTYCAYPLPCRPRSWPSRK